MYFHHGGDSSRMDEVYVCSRARTGSGKGYAQLEDSVIHDSRVPRQSSTFKTAFETVFGTQRRRESAASRIYDSLQWSTSCSEPLDGIQDTTCSYNQRTSLRHGAHQLG